VHHHRNWLWQVAEGEGDGVAGAVAGADPGAEVGAAGECGAVPPDGGGDDAVADCETGPRDGGALLALGAVECRAAECAVGEGPLRCVAPGSGAERGAAADGLTPPPAPASWIATVGVRESSTSAPAPPAASSPAVVSASTRVRDRRLRARRRSSRPEERRGPPRGATGLPYAPPVRGASAGRAAAAAANSSAGRPHPGQDRAPLRWRRQVRQ